MAMETMFGDFYIAERIFWSHFNHWKLIWYLWGDFELRLKYLIRRALYLGYRIRVAVD